MKISNSAALFLASSAALATTSNNVNVNAFAPLAVNPLKTTSSTARFFFDTTKGEGSESADGGKKQVTEDQKMQLKRMNYNFNRGVSEGGGDVPRVNPLRDIQSYVPVAEPVAIRNNLKGNTCIVSGARATPELFYLLNSEDSAFEFGKIVSISEDVSKTKKQLLTRTARYTGLLSKLAHEEGSVVPPSSVLEEASSWIALVDSVQDLQTLIPSASQVENLSVLFFSTPDAELQLEQLSNDLMAANPNASLVLVPQADVEVDPNEDPLEAEARPVTIMYYYEQGNGEPLEATAKEQATTAPAAAEGEEEAEAPKSFEPTLIHDPTFLDVEAKRLAIECLQLQAGQGKTLRVQCMEKKSVFDLMQLIKQEEPSVQNLFTKLILGLREAGYERSQEMAYMMTKGVEHLQSSVTAFSEANPNAAKRVAEQDKGTDGEVITTTNAWWEDPEFQELVKESSLRKEDMKQLEGESSSGDNVAAVSDGAQAMQ